MACVIVGAIFVFIPSSGFISGGQLIYFSMKGLLVEQQVEMGAIELKREVAFES